jgi:hypothetical protein
VQQVPDKRVRLLESTESLPVRSELEEELEEARSRQGARMAGHRAKSGLAANGCRSVRQCHETPR